MSRLLAVAAVFALFIAGIAVGAMGTHVFYDRHLAHQERPHPGMHRPHMTDRLLHRLRLTDEQQETIDDILERIHDEASDLRHDLQPRIHALMEHAHEEIEEILTPEQREKFKRFVERNRRRAEHFFLGPPERRARERDD